MQGRNQSHEAAHRGGLDWRGERQEGRGRAREGGERGRKVGRKGKGRRGGKDAGSED